MTIVLMMLAGGLGAVARFLVDAALARRLADARGHLTQGPPPVGTLVVNVVGSLLLGLLLGMSVPGHVSGEVVIVAGTGFCGGFTTFSTAQVEVVRLAQQRRYRVAAGLALVMLGASTLAAIAGLSVGRLL